VTILLADQQIKNGSNIIVKANPMPSAAPLQAPNPAAPVPHAILPTPPSSISSNNPSRLPFPLGVTGLLCSYTAPSIITMKKLLPTIPLTTSLRTYKKSN
jgi:DNA-binding helix-hairpin-helix protein with protein kinase domain